MLSLGDRSATRSLTGAGRSGVLALLSLLAVAVAACGGPPRQAEVADVDKESGLDMAASDESSAAAASAASASGGEQTMHAKCCAECKTGAAKDRTGAPKNTIPCADFTDVLSPWCLEHFRSQPTMASACE